MAEIRIQRRRHRNVWPWLLGLVALALLPLPFLASDRGGPARRATVATARAVPVRRDSVTRPDTSSAGTVVGAARPTTARGGGRTTASAAGAVTSRPSEGAKSAAPAPAAASAGPANEFERFVAAREPSPNERRHRDFTADALRRLANELRALGGSDAGASTIRANADSLQNTGAPSSAHPDQARAAFLAAVHEFDILRGRVRGAVVDTARLRAAAWAIQPDRPLLVQRARVQSFFDAAANALRSLTGAVDRRRTR